MQVSNLRMKPYLPTTALVVILTAVASCGDGSDNVFTNSGPRGAEAPPLLEVPLPEPGEPSPGEPSPGEPGLEEPALGEPLPGDPGKTMPDGSFDLELNLDEDNDTLIDIYTVAELNAIRFSLRRTGNASSGVGALNCGSRTEFVPCQGYELMANLSFAAVPNWLPIGHCISDTKCLEYFDGIFEGNGHTLDGLTVNLTAAQLNQYYDRNGPLFGAGLFAGASGAAAFRNLGLTNATVIADIAGVGALVGQVIPTAYHLDATMPLRNLQLADSRVHGAAKVGGIFGYCRSCNVDAVTVSGTTVAAAGEELGGLGGYAELSTFSNIQLRAAQVAGASHSGGVLGRSSGSRLTDARLEYSAVSAAGEFGGGLVGDSDDDKIHQATVLHSNISGGAYVGGLVGRMNAGSVSYSYAGELWVLEEESLAGGLVGGLEDGSLLTDSVSRNNIMFGDGEEKGALAGRTSNSNILRSYAYRGLLRGTTKLGGVTGSQLGASMIRDSYARYLVMVVRPSAYDEIYTGGLAGYSYAGLGSDIKVVNSYSALDFLNFGNFRGSRVFYGPVLGSFTLFPDISSSYWRQDFLQVGNLDILSYPGALLTTITTGAQLRLPTAATGIYAEWDGRASVCPDGTAAWDFGGSDQYPVLTCTPGGTIIQAHPAR